MFNSQQQQLGSSPNFREINGIRQHWGWFLAFGILLLILGMIAISAAFYTTVFSVFLFGILLLVGGGVQIAQSFLARKWSGVFLSLLLGVLYVVTGFLCVFKPTAMAVGLTLWIAAFCFIAGIFRMVNSAVLRFDHWGWVFFNGLITFLLGALILADWPLSGLWVIGLFVGIDMILTGWTCIMLSTLIKPRVR